MKRFCKVAALTIAALISASLAPARAADDAGTLLASSVQKAAANVTSFRMTLSGAQSVSSTMVVVRPDRVKSNMSFGPVTTETVIVGSTSYTRINGGQWLVSKMQNITDFANQWSATLAKQTTYTLLPDRVEAGVTYGAVMPAAGTTTPAAAPLTMQCTYDKVTYLMHVCTLQPPGAPFPMTLTYSAWNDPQNVVDVPADAPANK
jgi:hypothetical protein